MLYSYKVKAGTKLGYKIIGCEHLNESDIFNETDNFNLFKQKLLKAQKAAFSGQTDHDWSATYINSSINTAFGYLSTKLETFQTVLLVEIETVASMNLLKLVNSNNDIVTQSEKIKCALEMTFDKLLLKTIGAEMNAALITEDTSQILEVAFPHSLDNSKLVKLNLIAIVNSNLTPFGIKMPSEVLFEKFKIMIDKSHAFDPLQQPELNTLFSKFLPVNMNSFQNICVGLE